MLHNIVVHVCNPSIQEAREPQVQGQAEQHIDTLSQTPWAECVTQWQSACLVCPRPWA